MATPTLTMCAINARGHSGSVRKILDHAKRFVDLGWDVMVVAEKVDPADLAGSGIACRRVPRVWFGGEARQRERFRVRAEAVASGRPGLTIGHGDLRSQDVLHLHNCTHLVHEILHGRPIPPDDPLGRMHAAMLSGGAYRLLIANSALMKADITARFGVDPERVAVIHPGYDPAHFDAAQRDELRPGIRQELGLPADAPVVGVITSGSFRKRGVDVFLRALGGLPAELRESLHVVIAGNERKLAPYEELARAAGVGDRTQFLAPRQDVERLHHALDCYVHAAHFEEFGQSAQEAMVCGTAVVLTADVGVVERLPATQRDFVVPPGDPEALGAAIGKLLDEPRTRERWVATCQAACRDNTWEHNWAAHRAHYERLLS